MRHLLGRALFLAGVVAAILAVALAGAAVAFRQPSFGRAERILGRSASASSLERHVRSLTIDFHPRDSDHPENLAKAARYIAARFEAAGARVERQEFAIRGARFENVIGRFGSSEGRPLIVGAHYDAFGDFGDNPGADDNASGTAGLMELARLLAGADLRHPVELVAFSTEEPPFFGSPNMGSAVHARSLASRGVRPAGMICLEMIGYFSRNQPWPHWLFSLIYPDRGDFIGVAGRWQDRRLARSVKRAFRGASEVPVYSFNGPAVLSEASDQRNYWAQDWEAVMVTDTAFVRNPNYHSPADTASTLDYRRMAGVVDGIANAVLVFSSSVPPQRGP